MESSENNRINSKAGNKWYKARWYIPFLFIVGYMFTFFNYEDAFLEYLVLTVLSFLVCCLLLSVLNPPLLNKLPVWVILAVLLLAYYLKFYLINWGIHNIDNEFIYNFMSSSMNSFATLSYAFIVFCLTSWFLLSFSNVRQNKILPKVVNTETLFSFLILITLGLIIVTTLITHFYGILRMGVENPYLPFHLAGWVYHIRVTLIPSLLIILIWYSDEMNRRKYLTIGMLLLFLFGISDVLLRASRGTLINLFIMLTFLFIVTGRLSKQRFKLFIVVTIITILMFPLISSYRGIRADDSTSILNPLGKAFSSLSEESTSFSGTLYQGFLSVLFRFVGMETLMQAVLTPEPLGMEAFSVSIDQYFTQEILGIPPSVITSIAPSLLGWFYIVGGNLLVIIGMFLFTVAVWFIWRSLSRSKLRCCPVAQALFLFLLLGYSSGGIPDRLYLHLSVNVVAIVMCEWVMRRYEKRTRLHLIYKKD